MTRKLLDPKILKFSHDGPYPMEKMRDMACAHAEEMFSRYGECKPTWILNITDRLIWIETLWRDDEEKYEHSNRIGFMLQALQGYAYTFISEAWIAKQMPDENGNFPEETVKPSERPENERESVLIVLTQTREGQQLMTRYLVNEHRRGPNTLSIRVDEDMDGEFMGDMTDLFRRRYNIPPNLVIDMLRDFKAQHGIPT